MSRRVASIPIALALMVVAMPCRAALDCEALKTSTIPFQLTSEEAIQGEGDTKTISVVSQVFRGPDGVNTEVSALRGRKRETISKFGIETELLMESATRSFRISTLDPPDEDLLGQKRDFSLTKKKQTTTNNAEPVSVTGTYTFLGEGSLKVSGCPIPVLDYSVVSEGVLGSRGEFAYAPSLRMRLRSKDVTLIGQTELKPESIFTTFEPLPKPKH